MSETLMSAPTLTLGINASFMVEVVPAADVLPPTARIQGPDGKEPIALVFTVGGNRREVYLLDDDTRHDLRQALGLGLLLPDAS